MNLWQPSHLQRPSPPLDAAGRAGRRGSLRRLRASWIKWLAFSLFALSLLPGMMAGMLLIAESGDNHQLHCSFDAGQIRIVLAHPQQRRAHRHNWVERCLIHNADDPASHPDHRFSFHRQSAFEPQTQAQDSREIQSLSPPLTLSSFADPLVLPRETALSAAVRLLGRPRDPPRLVHAGIVLRC